MIRIAITTCAKLDDYKDAVRRAGGEPVVVDPAGTTPGEIVRQFDGLILTGGGDVLPSLDRKSTRLNSSH